jgi:uncharacterized repeat protein (TIGR02543 family)
MPTADYSQTTRTKLLAAKELSKFHRLNPYSPQGGRYPFSQTELLYENLGTILGGCCSTTNTPASSPAPAPGSGYTVTYVGNTNTGGTAPTDGSSPYNSGSSVTILGNSGTLTKTGFLFAGWNTAADGSGLPYVGGNTFSINANTTLYAQWLIAQSPRLVYNRNAPSGGGTAPSSSGTSYPSFSSVDIVGNTGSFTNGSLVFGGWNTAADGSGTSYPAGSEYTMPGSGTVNLYAQWIDPATTYTLTYDANAAAGGSGSPPAAPTAYSSNTSATILGNKIFAKSSWPT